MARIEFSNRLLTVATVRRGRPRPRFRLGLGADSTVDYVPTMASIPSIARAALTSRQTLAWRLTLLGSLILGLALSWHTTGDLDLPLHDRIGRDILAGEPPPTTNQFSFTAPDHRWVDHEWAFQVLTALAGQLAGGDDLAGRATGWQWLRVLLTALLLGALWRDLTPRTRRWPAAAVYLGPLILLTFAMLWTRLTLRPELISYTLVVLVLRRVEKVLAGDPDPESPWWRVLVDPRGAGGQALLLTLVWYQMHGFAVLAPALWLLGGLLAPSHRPLTERWRLSVTGAALGLLAGLVTPNGVAGLLYPLQALGQFNNGADLQHTISELVPLLETRGSLALTLILFQLSLIWGVVWSGLNWGHVSRLRLALWLLAAIAAWQGQRNLGIYAVTFLLLPGGELPANAVATPWRRWSKAIPEQIRQWTARVCCLVLPAMTWLVMVVWLVALADNSFYLREGVARRWGPGLTPANYPTQAARHLAAVGNLRLANNVDAASTIVAGGGGQVAIDGRTEAYPARAWRAYSELKRGDGDALRRMRTWRAEGVCLAHRNSAAQALIRTLLGQPEWSLVAADEAGVAFLPRPTATTTTNADILRQSSASLRTQLATATPQSTVRQADRAVAWAALLLLAGDPTTAEEFLLLARERCAEHPIALHNHGNLLLARGEFRGALRVFQAAARLNRNAAPPLVNAGNCLFQLGRISEAESAFAAAVRRDPDNFEGWANLAEVRRRTGDRDGASRAYERALELRPGDNRLRARARTL